MGVLSSPPKWAQSSSPPLRQKVRTDMAGQNAPKSPEVWLLLVNIFGISENISVRVLLSVYII